MVTMVMMMMMINLVLLGSFERPVEPHVDHDNNDDDDDDENHQHCNIQATCSPVSVESDTIKACICTTDFCRWTKFNAFIIQ